jgi:hypothetical protein
MGEPMQLSDTQELAMRLIQSGRNILLQGPAGSGKSVTVERAVQALRQARKRVAVVAPTAAAAFLVGGCTLHSLLSPLPQYTTVEQLVEGVDHWLNTQVQYDGSSNVRNVKRQQRHLAFTTLDTIIVDEASMLRPDLLYVLDKVACTTRRNKLPFGGIQIALVGDLAQLAPVPLKTGADGSKRGSELFFFELAHANLHNSFERGNFEAITLDRVYRQTDSVFLNVLGYARQATPFDDWSGECQAAFLDRCVDPPDDMVLTCMNVTNRAVDDNNQRQLDRLNSDTFMYKPRFSIVRSGVVHVHDSRELTDEHRKKYSISPALANVLDTALKELRDVTIRVGAVVMISHNIPEQPHLFRGLVGTVTYANEKFTTVEFPHGVERVEAIELRQLDPDATFADDETGTKNYLLTRFMPLRLAWSVTVHRAQGCTVSAALVTLDPLMMPGSAYTALSRLRSLDGLYIKLGSSRALETCFQQSLGMQRFERWLKKRRREQETDK